MLEVIKELIPLLEGAKDGVVWLVAAYFGMMVGKWVLTCATILLLARMAIPFFLSLAHGQTIKTSWYDLSSDNGHRYIFDAPDFKGLLKTIADRDGQVSKWDIKRAIETLERAKS